MKLKALPEQDGVARLSLSIRNSTSKLLEDYLRFYQATYNQSVEKSRLVDAILKDYFESDASFRAYVRKAQTPAAAADDTQQS